MVKRRKQLVVFTFFLFLGSLATLALSHAVWVSKPLIIATKDYPRIGEENAPVEIVVFEDFLCRTCCYFSLEVFPKLQSAYIDRGVAQYVMVPLAFSSDSQKIANAAYDIFHQNSEEYFPFVRELFLEISDAKKLTFQDLLNMAAQMNAIDQTQFERSVKSGRFDQQLERNLELAKKAMKKNLHTPSIFINGHLISGISFQTLSVQIEKILQQQERQ
ncbi:MAG TPA: thioredoxin domain-containing protein [Chlamydiales bacterium]|nr:thioredoxin domain-containing protein [Chlamydiales bacterium]